jgi:hypothetical protein
MSAYRFAAPTGVAWRDQPEHFGKSATHDPQWHCLVVREEL